MFIEAAQNIDGYSQKRLISYIFHGFIAPELRQWSYSPQTIEVIVLKYNRRDHLISFV